MRKASCTLFLSFLIGAGGANAWAAPASETGTPGKQAAATPPAVAPDSPRASVTRFLELCDEGRFGEAAGYLALEGRSSGGGALLARRLKHVLDRRVPLDLTRLSPRSTGDDRDGLPAGVDEIGRIDLASGGSESVLLVRASGPRGGRWRFAPETVQRIDGWYSALPRRWLLDRLPAPLLRTGPRGILYWQWLALPLLLVVGIAIGTVLGRLTRALLRRLTLKTETRWDDALLKQIGGPLVAVWQVAALYVLLPFLDLYAPAEASIHSVLRLALLLILFWSLLRGVDVAREVLAASAWARTYPASRSLLPLGARSTKAVIVVFGLIAALAELGYPVASLLAGLGVGGLALALAAQKTVENLFGAFSIGVDQPFREGDFVKIEDFVGTVEKIGLRSTRIRTLDRTLVSVPNGKLSEMRLESITARDRIRLACTIGLVYDTTEAQMRAVLAGLEQKLRAHPKIWPDAVTVRFKEFAASSLDIEVMAWFMTADWSEFQLIRQEMLLGFMAVVEGAGTSFAFPTQTIQLAGGPPPPT